MKNLILILFAVVFVALTTVLAATSVSGQRVTQAVFAQRCTVPAKHRTVHIDPGRLVNQKVNYSKLHIAHRDLHKEPGRRS